MQWLAEYNQEGASLYTSHRPAEPTVGGRSLPFPSHLVHQPREEGADCRYHHFLLVHHPSEAKEGWWTRRKWWYRQSAPSSLGWWTRWEGKGRLQPLTVGSAAVGSVKRNTFLVVLSQPLLILMETFCVGMI